LIDLADHIAVGFDQVAFIHARDLRQGRGKTGRAAIGTPGERDGRVHGDCAQPAAVAGEVARLMRFEQTQQLPVVADFLGLKPFL